MLRMPGAIAASPDLTSLPAEVLDGFERIGAIDAEQQAAIAAIRASLAP